MCALGQTHRNELGIVDNNKKNISPSGNISKVIKVIRILDQHLYFGFAFVQHERSAGRFNRDLLPNCISNLPSFSQKLYFEGHLVNLRKVVVVVFNGNHKSDSTRLWEVVCVTDWPQGPRAESWTRSWCFHSHALFKVDLWSLNVR